MYSQENQMAVVHTYTNASFNENYVIRTLEYPSPNVLSSWYQKYKATGTLYEKSRPKPRYTWRRKKNGYLLCRTLCFSHTSLQRSRLLAHRDMFRVWIQEIRPDLLIRKQVPCKKNIHLIRYTKEEKYQTIAGVAMSSGILHTVGLFIAWSKFCPHPFDTYLTGGVMTVLNQFGEKVAEGEAVGTGYTIGLGDGTVAQITAVVAGDLDGNSKINMQDLVTMQRAMLNMQQLEGAYLKAAIPASGNASGPRMNDLVLLRRYLLRLTPSMYE